MNINTGQAGKKKQRERENNLKKKEDNTPNAVGGGIMGLFLFPQFWF